MTTFITVTLLATLAVIVFFSMKRDTKKLSTVPSFDQLEPAPLFNLIDFELSHYEYGFPLGYAHGKLKFKNGSIEVRICLDFYQFDLNHDAIEHKKISVESIKIKQDDVMYTMEKADWEMLHTLFNSNAEKHYYLLKSSFANHDAHSYCPSL